MSIALYFIHTYFHVLFLLRYPYDIHTASMSVLQVWIFLDHRSIDSYPAIMLHCVCVVNGALLSTVVYHVYDAYYLVCC